MSPGAEAVVSAVLSLGACDAAVVKTESLRFSLGNPDYPEDLSYMERGRSSRENLKLWHPESRTVLVSLWQYWNSMADYRGMRKAAVSDLAGFFRARGRKAPRARLSSAVGKEIEIARYALFRDYHRVIRKKLSEAVERIASEFPGLGTRIFVDTSPVAEKRIAEKAGLGFIGKNGLLINPKHGSWFLIGGISMDADFDVPEPEIAAGRCGECDLCARACPAKAIEKEGFRHPGRCLSYWTTQHKGPVPERVAEKLESRIYGCDICQEVCPFNESVETEILREFLEV